MLFSRNRAKIWSRRKEIQHSQRTGLFFHYLPFPALLDPPCLFSLSQTSPAPRAPPSPSSASFLPRRRRGVEDAEAPALLPPPTASLRRRPRWRLPGGGPHALVLLRFGARPAAIGEEELRHCGYKKEGLWRKSAWAHADWLPGGRRSVSSVSRRRGSTTTSTAPCSAADATAAACVAAVGPAVWLGHSL